MAAINDLLRQITDPALRSRLEQEVARISKNKKFGLVFEEHIPECTPLYGVPVKRGSTVARKAGKINDVFTAVKLTDDIALCRHKATGDMSEIPVSELVSAAQFGEPIFPTLEPIDYVENAPDSGLWHTLIEADNYHALQLLEYLYPKQVDCIYIDPPYNTGARDWKYNNDYVDSSDSWRHSKWMSMMQKRIVLAKRLLCDNGILVITIDDNELSHLDCLLQEVFPEYDRFIVTIEHSKRGRRGKNMAKSNEFALFLVKHGLEVICQEPTEGLGGEVRNLRRTGSGSLRTQRPRKFYPIYIDIQKERVVEIGESLLLEDDIFFSIPDDVAARHPDSKLTIVWPFDEAGTEKNWHYAAPRAKSELASGKLSVREQSYGWQVYYQLRDRNSKKYKTVWTGSHLDASTHGTELLSTIFGRGQSFDFPKSLYAVQQCLYACVLDKPNALILDFFAGSGTTLNAVNLINAEDNGSRRCILVTNNEVSESQAKALRNKGVQPGDADWESQGICRAVTWPRNQYTILGKRPDGTILNGEYYTNQIKTHEVDRKYYQLGFVDKPRNLSISAKKQMLSLLKDKTGKSVLPQSLVKEDSAYIVSENHNASILFDPDYYDGWMEELEDKEHITDIYIVTSDVSVFRKLKNLVNELLGAYEVTEKMKRPMSDGFPANVEYFKLGFLDKNSVSLGQQFREILPLLWLKSGSVGRRPEISDECEPEMLILPQNRFAILVDETKFAEFAERLAEQDEFDTIYFVTNSEDAFRAMSAEVKASITYQLYRDYIDNFVLGSRRDS